ncbi:MAG: sodium/proton-translocating pyrophosphatase, partial [Candidatus Hydrogenedentes bacterium]|nr:sodium/proton-translocating pyrophosphatase [Candidatus Hydrogenedentota bacterium]
MGESGFLGVAGFASLCALAFVAYLAKYVLSKSQGNETMARLSRLVQEGAAAFLKREYSYVAVFVVVIMAFFVVVGWVKPDLGLSWRTSVAFLFGAV